MKRRYHQYPDGKKRGRITGICEDKHASRGSSNEVIISAWQESVELASQSKVEGQTSSSADICAPLLTVGKSKSEDILDSEPPSIHLSINPSTLVSNPNYVLTPFFHRGVSGFAEILAGEAGNYGQFAVARSVARALLDSMGFECDVVGTHKSSSTSNTDLHQITVKSFSKERRPVQTATSTRDYALLQIAVYQKCKEHRDKNDSDDETDGNIMGEIALAFRIAAHFALSYESKKIEKFIGLRKRALMTLIVSLRGLLLRLIEQLNDGEENDSNIKAFFISKDLDSFSDAEHLLLDIVPLLTDMSEDLGALGEKKAVSLAHNLLKLDSNMRDMRKVKKRKKSTLPSQETGQQTSMNKKERRGQFTTILRGGLIELFFRQLLKQEHQEHGKNHVRELVVKLQSRYIGSTAGAIASLLPSLTKSCAVTIDKISDFFCDKNREMEEDLRIRKEDQREYMVYSSTETRIHDREDLNLLRLDGCIYLSRLMKLMASVKESPQKLQNPMHPESVNKYVGSHSNEDINNCKKDRKQIEEDLIDRKQKVCQKAFFLFHTLMENDPSSTRCMSNMKSVKRRENLMSAVFASIM